MGVQRVRNLTTAAPFGSGVNVRRTRASVLAASPASSIADASGGAASWVERMGRTIPRYVGAF